MMSIVIIVRMLVLFFTYLLCLLPGDDAWRLVPTDVYKPLRQSIVRIGVDGSIFILNSKEHHVTRLSSKGEVLATIGKKGQGPGHLQWPDSFYVDDTSVYIWGQHANIEVFDYQGNFVERIKPPSLYLELCKVKTGWVYSTHRVPRSETEKAGIFHADLHFKKLEKLKTIEHCGHGNGVFMTPKGASFSAIDTSPLLICDPAGEVIFFTEGQRKRIYQIEDKSVTLFSQLEHVPLQFDENWAESELGKYYEHPSSLPPRTKIQRKYPSHFPVIKRLGITPTGNLWYTRWTRIERSRNPIVILNKKGAILAQPAEMKKHLSRIFGFHHGQAYVAVFDSEEDVGCVAVGPRADMLRYMDKHVNHLVLKRE